MQQGNPDDFQCYQVIYWLEEAQKVQDLSKDYPVEPICCFLQEFCKIFKKMSRLLGIAFSDVNEKVQIMRERNLEYQENQGMFSIIQKEKERGVLEMNGDNNGKLTTDKSLKKYVSFGRSLLRMMRFMDYLKIMFTEILNDRQQKISDACSKAYMKALYPHHTFLVQTAAKAAMMAAPERSKILQYFIANHGGEKEAYEAMERFVQNQEPVRLALWEFYNQKGYNNLP